MDKMKRLVVLFYPKTDSANRVRFAPLSLIKIGSQLKCAGYDVAVIDERFEEDYESRLRELLGRALFFGVSVMTGYQIKGALKASRTAKRLDASVPVVWGGWHPSLLPKETLVEGSIDIAVRGQGEAAVLELADALVKGSALDGIKGISFKKNGKVVSNQAREFQDINGFGRVRFDVVDLGRYISKSPLGERTIFWNSSQGCPYTCGFCCTPNVYCRKWSGLDADTLLEQIKALVREYGVNGITFAEDNFLVDVKRVERFCKGLVAERLGVRWETDVRIDSVNRFSDDFLNMLKESGCHKLFVGAESGDPEVLELIDKRIRIEDSYEMAARLGKHRIISEFFMIVGFPQAPKRDLARTLAFIKDMKSRYPDHQFTAFLYTPYPGTPLLDISVKSGLKVPGTLEEWSSWDVLNVHTPWVNKRYLDRANMHIKYLYPLAFPSEALRKKISDLWRGLPYRVLHRIARFRLAKDFFHLPLEWEMLKAFHALQTRYGLFSGIGSFR